MKTVKQALITNGGTYSNHFGLDHATRLSFNGIFRREKTEYIIDLYIFTSVDEFLNCPKKLIRSFNLISVLNTKSLGEKRLHPHGFENADDIADEIQDKFQFKLYPKGNHMGVWVCADLDFTNEREKVETFAFGNF